jgi:predicted nucleotidyltransferase
VAADGQTRHQLVGISETFNYLLGLHVQTRRVYDDDGRRYVIYRGQRGHRSIAVIRRESEGWQGKAFERDKDFEATPKLTEGADQEVANGDAVITNARALESIFKVPMCAGGGRTMSVKVDVPNEEIAAFCRRHYIRKLAFFGSVLRDDFTPESDVDVLVEFEPGHTPGLAFFAMQRELSAILGRKVDMNTAKGLSPYFRQEVLAGAEILYVAA